MDAVDVEFFIYTSLSMIKPHPYCTHGGNMTSVHLPIINTYKIYKK